MLQAIRPVTAQPTLQRLLRYKRTQANNAVTITCEIIPAHYLVFHSRRGPH